ncbi:DUF6049 family protein [Microbacterium paludicola]|uniref:DUF6049 family protein n=1 Tax=Microbacterium paludicola TaxID=300019 RepID=UPI0031D51F07
MTTDLPRGRAARSRRRLHAPLPAAAFAVLLGLSYATPVHAAVAEEEPPQLTVAAASRGVLQTGSSLTATLTITNPADEPLEGSSARLQLGRTPLADRDALHDWLEGPDPEVELTPVGSGPADDIAPGETDTVGITVAADHTALAGLQPGVYPLRAQYGEASADTVVVVPQAAAQPVGLVMPITAPVADRGLLDADRLAQLTGTDGVLTAQLDAAAGSEAILAIDPAIPAAIRALGETAPVSAVQWLDRLMLAPNDRFALQFGDADVAAQLQAGLTAPLQPLSLEGYLPPEPAEPDPTPTPTESPASTGDDDQDGLDLDDLLDIGDDPGSVYWPVPGHATAAVIDGLHAADPEAVTLTPSTATAQGADLAGVAAAGVTAGGGAALVYDGSASAALDEVAKARDEGERATAAAAAAAELWFAGRDVGGAPVLVALDRATPALAAAADETTGEAPVDLEAQLDEALDVVTLSSAVEAQSLSDLLDAQRRRIAPAENAPSDVRTTFVKELGDSEQRVAHTATVLETPDVLTGLVRAEALQALGVGWEQRADEWQDALGAFRQRTRERANAVGIQDPTPVNLVSAGADLPVWVRNDLPYPVTVTLHADPQDLRLDVADEKTVTIQPSSSTTVQMPVEARVGSGNVDIELTLLSPTGEVIGPRQTVEVAVRADWERIGIGILVVLVVGLIGTGIVRTILRRRRTTAAAAETDPEAQDAADGTDDSVTDPQKTEKHPDA